MRRAVAGFGAIVAALVMAPVQAAETPRPSQEDHRVRLVKYQPQQVVVVQVRRGTVTRISLAADEKIEVAVTGLSSRCGTETDVWCVHAKEGSNQIFVRPKEDAARNNLELRTNLRDYSLEFVTMDDSDKGKARRDRDAFHRVIFEYESPKPAAAAVSPAKAVIAGLLQAIDAEGQADQRVAKAQEVVSSPQERLKNLQPEARNAHYTMQVLKNGEDAAPSLVFDDGRFTYFEFKGVREIPAIFAYGSDGQEARVNWHFETPFVVVHRTARRFTLRLGNAVVGVFNEAFDPVGVDAPAGTVSAEVVREIKGAAR